LGKRGELGKTKREGGVEERWRGGKQRARSKFGKGVKFGAPNAGGGTWLSRAAAKNPPARKNKNKKHYGAF
jgi:hypothetical protein